MEAICLQCGDEGFTNAFVYCIKCLQFAVHRYCLDVLPETYDEFVHWVCDYCNEEVQNQSVVQKCEAIPSQSRDVNTDEFSHVETKRNEAVIVDARPIKCDPTDKKCNDNRMQQAKSSQGTLRSKKMKRSKNRKRSRNVKRSTVSAQLYDERVKASTMQIQCADMSIENKELACVTYRGFSDGLVVSSFEPVITPIWRGNFNIWNKELEILDGLMAHLSGKACQKVHDAASEFEHVIELEMLSRSKVWPKSFDTSDPTGDNIALYFFPSKKSERAFDYLVEKMIDEDLALKGVMQKAELLIFTSTELPVRYWRFQGKHYLWGVFRGKQSPLSQSNSCSTQLVDNANHGKVDVISKRYADRSPVSPLSNSSSCGPGAF